MDNDNEGLVSGVPNETAGHRVANVPPCKPMFYHNLAEMPTSSSRSLVRKALYGWFGLTFIFIWNFVAMSAFNFTPYTDDDGKSQTTGFGVSWIISLVLVLVGIPVTFTIYMCLYSAARKSSSMYYFMFFIVFGALIIFFILCVFGVPPESIGSAGLLELISASGKGHSTAVAILVAIAFACWVIAVGYSVYLFLLVRIEYKGAGGIQAARKEATRAAATTAYDHREDIKDAAWEHREEIKQVAVDNKDLLVQVAKENQDVAVKLAKDNPDLAWQMAVAAAQDGDGAAPAANTNKNLDDDINWAEFA